MWAIIGGIICLVPFVVMQCLKVKLEKEMLWQILTAILAGIGILMISLGV